MKPKPGTVRTSVDLPVQLHRRLRELAAQEGCSARNVIVGSVEATVERETFTRPKQRLDLRNHPLVSVGGPPIDPTPEEIDELVWG